MEPGVLEHVRGAYEQEKTRLAWQRGEIMILQNLLFAYGRGTSGGLRKIVVAMD
ncbi:hypothetical protein [Streptomyces sp. NPDC045470]|uniref:hypothetical protein n=1 Tax=Streptomyces sp. NPDC045470 TaxID=3155469 RepID=UPI0033E20EF3